ncbi:MAG: PspC domain-containing protein, partial [Clostridia bacterium]|nr:PspC domain-containing protein [Clostridia bacterium]
MSSSRQTTHGRLHKSSGNKKISGVCAGVAEWLGVDPSIVRIAWAVLACGWGTGILLYFICAVILP